MRSGCARLASLEDPSIHVSKVEAALPCMQVAAVSSGKYAEDAEATCDVRSRSATLSIRPEKLLESGISEGSRCVKGSEDDLLDHECLVTGKRFTAEVPHCHLTTKDGSSFSAASEAPFEIGKDACWS